MSSAGSSHGSLPGSPDGSLPGSPDGSLPGSPLVTVEELAAELAGPRPPVLLDVRWPIPGPPDLDGYLAGHLPGARFVDLDALLSAPPRGPHGGRHPLPTAEDFTAAMQALGVRRDRPVVLYDAAAALAAGRGWWCLRYFGHPDVRVLDGGLVAWQAAGQPVETGEPPAAPEPGDWRAEPGHLPLLDADAAATLARKGLLLDARSAARYAGEDPVDPVRGHIPGAVSAPTTANVDAAGRWLPPAALRERFHALGVDGADEVGVYCGSGVTAAHTVLAMQLAGAEPPALYVGSWSEWIAQDGRPVATGTEPA